MELPIVAGIAVVVFLFATRQYAYRRVAARDGHFVWLVFLPTLLAGFAILGIGVQMLADRPPLGIVMVVTGSVFLALLIGFLTRASHSIRSSGPQAIFEPFADYAGTVMGFVLIGALAALVGLVVWAVSQAAH